LTEVERVADRVLILVEGRAAALERLAVLRERQARDVQVAIEQGVEPPSLEDVFLSVVRGERATLTPSDGART
jgi:ABC-type multidrug transport system ATPase subunit